MTAPSCGCDEEVQCGRCGSSMGNEDCQVCAACGYFDEPDPNCPVCKGTGTVTFCLSSVDWCEANPRPGCEQVAQSTEDYFTVHHPDCPLSPRRTHPDMDSVL